MQGYRTLDDLDNSGELNRVQLIGLKHYDNFNERMMREEVEEIEARVSATADSYTIFNFWIYSNHNNIISSLNLWFHYDSTASHLA